MKLNNIPIKLDDRINDIEDIKTVITADENDVAKWVILQIPYTFSRILRD